MKKALVSMAFILICFLLQSTLFTQFSIGGIAPNLLVIVTVSLGFLLGKKSGIAVGFVCGLMVDIFFGSILGLYTLIYMYVGYANGLFKKIIFPEDIKLPLGLIIGSDFCYNIICYFFLFLLRGKFHFGFYFTHVILPEMVYTSLIACLLYPLIHSIYRKLNNSEKKGE